MGRFQAVALGKGADTDVGAGFEVGERRRNRVVHGVVLVEHDLHGFAVMGLHREGVSIDAFDLAAQSLALRGARSEEHTSELPSLMRISYAVFCLKKKQD